jgi:hypothetical protein
LYGMLLKKIPELTDQINEAILIEQSGVS